MPEVKIQSSLSLWADPVTLINCDLRRTEPWKTLVSWYPQCQQTVANVLEYYGAWPRAGLDGMDSDRPPQTPESIETWNEPSTPQVSKDYAVRPRLSQVASCLHPGEPRSLWEPSLIDLEMQGVYVLLRTRFRGELWRPWPTPH